MKARYRVEGRLLPRAVLSLLGFLAGAAQAGSVDLLGVNVDYKLTLNYGVGIRTEPQAQGLINGPIDPFQLHLNEIAQGTGFTHTGLPTTVNQDDGDRNFNQWSLVNDRVSGLLETQLTWQNYGMVFSGDGFYDWTYHRHDDNDSPDTVNKTGPINQFTPGARYYDGNRFRFLDAYAYGDWTLFDNLRLDLRAGQQLVAWGESLFFPGVSSAQSTADATKAFTPGVEIKQILLPTNQISLNLAVGQAWDLMGYYKLDFKRNEIFPVGDYLSPTDSVGPGAQFSYGAVNPLNLSSCPGLLGALSNLCNLGGVGGTLLKAPADILIPYEGERKPGKFGQYGVGLKYQATADTTLGLYWLRYSDPNPSVVQQSGYPVIATFPTTLTTSLFNEPTADDYYAVYFNGIHMLAGSYSTVLGPFNVAGEASYRQHAAVAVQAVELGTIDPVFSRGNIVQVLNSAIYAANPHLWYDDVALVGEAGYLRVTGVDAAQSQPGIAVVGNGQTLFYSRNAWGFEALCMPTKRDIIGGWDLSTPVSFGWLTHGNPSLPGGFGALYGQGDMRLSVSATMQYLQNLQFGVGYNFFFGSPDKTIGDSFLKRNPYEDRDYLTFNVKYTI
jgi:uncharacterized protein DUF1302